MSTGDRRSRYASVMAGARTFALIVLAPPVAITQDYAAIVNVILLAAVWLCATFADGRPRIVPMVALGVESSLVTFIAILTVPVSPVLLPALVIPPFIGGLVRGVRGSVEALVAELMVAAAVLATGPVAFTDDLGAQLFAALAGGLGLGSIAALFHNARERGDGSSSYRDARALLLQLRDLSGDLVGGLDPVRICDGIIDLAREELPLTGAVVYVQSPHGYVPLLEGDVTDSGADNTSVLDAVFRSGKPVVEGPWIGLPLITDAGTVAAITGGLLPTARPSFAALHQALDHLAHSLRREALQLDTALLFASLRDEATAEERRRLARDLHDGVAQDLASLGYLIDDITETATEPEVVARSSELRGELTRVVAELRRSVFLLRNEGEGNSLGESVEALARHLESRSGISVVVTRDEGTLRLRPDVEAELLRIAQEGINNAVRHAHADHIDVTVRVHAPEATIRVVDDGRGLGTARDDSHGIRIMRERARRIGATLRLEDATDGPGTELEVVLTHTSRLEGPGTTAHREGVPS